MEQFRHSWSPWIHAAHLPTWHTSQRTIWTLCNMELWVSLPKQCTARQDWGCLCMCKLTACTGDISEWLLKLDAGYLKICRTWCIELRHWLFLGESFKSSPVHISRLASLYPRLLFCPEWKMSYCQTFWDSDHYSTLNQCILLEVSVNLAKSY